MDDVTEADMKINSTFGDVVHQNDGTNLGCGIDDNEEIRLLSQRYDLSKGVVMRRILDILTDLTTGVVERQCNSKSLIAFPIFVLQCKKVFVSAKYIC